MTGIEIAREPYGSPLSRPLTNAQANELVERYGGWEGAGAEPEPAAFDDPDGYFAIARVEGRPVGCAGICRCEGEQIAELRRMYVAPGARRLSVARALMSELEARARRLGYRTLRAGDRSRAAGGDSPLRSERVRDHPQLRALFGAAAEHLHGEDAARAEPLAGAGLRPGARRDRRRCASWSG
jgi:GNAT superfamily N-acetyltransferase